jgi:hypothetical protein
MRRLAVLALFAASVGTRAEQFDYYTNPVLSKAVSDGLLKEAKQLTSDEVGEYTSVLADSPSAFLIVATNDKRFAKLLVQPARQKVGDKQAPLLLVDKFVTFKGTTERAIQSTGQALHLYPGLRLSLDIGQVVPEAIGGRSDGRDRQQGPERICRQARQEREALCAHQADRGRRTQESAEARGWRGL